MAMEITNSYSSYAAQGMAGSSAANSTKKKETEKTSQTVSDGRPKSTAAYISELEKLVPSVELKVGTGFSSAKTGKTLTINPQLLEKMQNDPEKEKEMKEMIKGVESATKLIDGIHRASGWTVVYRHSYIDENGKYCAIALVRNDFMLNMSDKLREERRENSEKLLEKSKVQKAEKQEELEEILEEKQEEKVNTEEQSAYDRAAQLIKEKMAASKDGVIYLDDEDMRTMLEAAKEDDAGKADTEQQMIVGANLDIKI